jgi:signal transduction histidine kinase
MAGMETKRKVLVVDDNAELAQIVSQFLESRGYQISMAQSGNAAIRKVSSESPEVVLLDLKLPDISGAEVLKRIKEIDDGIGVIILTGYGGEQVAVELMKSGATDFISKPFERDVLLGAVKNALRMRDGLLEDKKLKRYSSLEKFFPFLAHEIRNPLHAIGGAVAIIRRRSDSSDEYLNKSIKIIQEEVDHLNEFVQECLDFVRPPMKSNLMEVDINEVISIVINIIAHMSEELFRKIRIVTDLDPGLPKVYGNYEEIKRAFLNIVKNGFEAMGEGGEFTIKTNAVTSSTSGSVEIVFSDNGEGIKKDDLASLFHPFFTTKLRGTGLGLAICHRIIVERHHGKIHVVSERGRGTTIRIELPVNQPTEIAGGNGQ